MSYQVGYVFNNTYCSTPPLSFVLTVAHPLGTNIFLSSVLHCLKKVNGSHLSNYDFSCCAICKPQLDILISFLFYLVKILRKFPASPWIAFLQSIVHNYTLFIPNCTRNHVITHTKISAYIMVFFRVMMICPFISSDWNSISLHSVSYVTLYFSSENLIEVLVHSLLSLRRSLQSDWLSAVQPSLALNRFFFIVNQRET